MKLKNIYKNKLSEGSRIVKPIDKDMYPDKSSEGLEGPYQLNSGKVVYYDPIEGKYYDSRTDMFLSQDEYDDAQNMYECEDDMDTQTQAPNMNISSNINTNGTRSLSVSAEGEAAEELLRVLQMAGLQPSGNNKPMTGMNTISQDDGQSTCGCMSWDCKTCFPDSEAQGPQSPISLEGLENIEGEESPLTYGEENLEEEDNNKDEIIKQIMGVQSLGLSQSETEYSENELKAMSEEELEQIKTEILGSADNETISAEEPEQPEETPPQEPVNQTQQQPSQVPNQQPSPDQEVMEWLERFRKLGEK